MARVRPVLFVGMSRDLRLVCKVRSPFSEGLKLKRNKMNANVNRRTTPLLPQPVLYRFSENQSRQSFELFSAPSNKAEVLRYFCLQFHDFYQIGLACRIIPEVSMKFHFHTLPNVNERVVRRDWVLNQPEFEYIHYNCESPCSSSKISVDL